MTDIAIDINVRGRIFTTLRSTVESHGGMLASMLSESWAQSDSSGRPFLNLNPNHFSSMLDDILLAQQSPLDHWGACGDQTAAYFAFLDFLGLLQPVEEQNYLLAGRTSCQKCNDNLGAFVSQASIFDRIQTWGIKIWSGFRGNFDKREGCHRTDLVVPLPFFGVLITDQTLSTFCSKVDEGNGLLQIMRRSEKWNSKLNQWNPELCNINHQMIGWGNEDLLRLDGASMHSLQQGDLIYMQLDPQKGLLRMRCQRFGVHVLEKRVPKGQLYHVFIGLDNNMCAELTPIDWYKRVLPGVEI
jgi:hypothetical protein